MISSGKLDYAERWMRDGLDACQVPAYFESLDVDMSDCRELLAEARLRGVRLTYVHLFVRATALALAANPDLHQMVCGNRRYNPLHVDIALSVAGETAVAPLLVLEAAEQKDLSAIASEVIRRAPEAREADRKMLAALRRWGWILPSGLLRRSMLRGLFRSVNFRRKGSGTFQVSVLPGIDQAGSPVFSTSAMLVAGGVRDRVIAENGIPVVRPIVTLTCCADHRVWDGRAGQRFLEAVRGILESRTLLRELETAENAIEESALATFA